MRYLRNKSENRIADYQDREEIYERQRRKCTIIKSAFHDPDIDKEWTHRWGTFIYAETDREHSSRDVGDKYESSSGECYLNQKYRSMQEKHIAVILKVGDLQEICLEEEEIVILLSNLLDNAIRESEKYWKYRKAVIHLKLECEDHKLIFAVRNPVTEKVEIEMTR